MISTATPSARDRAYWEDVNAGIEESIEADRALWVEVAASIAETEEGE